MERIFFTTALFYGRKNIYDTALFYFFGCAKLNCFSTHKPILRGRSSMLDGRAPDQKEELEEAREVSIIGPLYANAPAGKG